MRREGDLEGALCTVCNALGKSGPNARAYVNPSRRNSVATPLKMRGLITQRNVDRISTWLMSEICVLRVLTRLRKRLRRKLFGPTEI